MTHTRTASLEALRKLHDGGAIARPAEDAPAVDLPDGFWDTAEARPPRAKTPVSLRVDADVLDYFRSQGKGHLTRMHAVLRAYVDAKKDERSTG